MISTELPTVAGPYWWRENAESPWQIVKVGQRREGDLATFQFSSSGWPLKNVDNPGQWVAIESPPL